MASERPEGRDRPLTFPYKVVEGRTNYIDVFLPPTVTSEEPLHTVLYFHGGGLTVGNRNSWFPHWIFDRALEAGYAFMSADYSLLGPLTAHNVLEDIEDLFRFLVKDLNKELATTEKTGLRIDPSSIVVSGSSAGGLCAYLAALHAVPKPKGILSLYGMGGNFLLPQYLAVKTEPFFIGREILDPDNFRQFLAPFPPDLQATSDSNLLYHPQDHPSTPGWPANPRMQLCRLYLQLGMFLDYYTGEHVPSLSTYLRTILESESSNVDVPASALRDAIPSRHIRLFPQFLVDSTFPPTFIIHGEQDSAVRVQESHDLKELLDAAGVEAVLCVIEGQEHSFDYSAAAKAKFAPLFDEAFIFIRKIFHGV
ncbi:hypothetical protein EW145_g848 [Phellinidium pouzarii]|uniref:BD-FAE-like domain-containing protein n=1 Tax=Phellinidium pouzarii TaxID=167371 RepID=A0A4S4LGS6_9AGAM|nr:hypothetical protein EW145_g848 [Phellinidium pouzarii]